ncbi:ABC transporter ATP-binding protein [Kineosporia succinea]|uniref:ABC-type multidrug transport system ATPase subunit n=1 Tax=Kineosporia succinea TaxID=84632 RepID=A0ABT9PAH9_9ACTN|nr:ABC transporter ATP-binding protein [Kineosporia succinea]MDP9829703.1 ABC-type multidrug transport system ATPase subunit [Kineosporia succinea]
MLRVTGVSKRYGSESVLTDVSLTLPAGGVMALTGPNGAGKSTLLDCLSGATPMDAGTVEIFGRPSHPSSAEHWLAVYGILNDFTWLPGLTVIDHLMLLAPSPPGASVQAALDAFGVPDLGGHRPTALSSGQRRRVALASARVRPWSVLLLDEPEAHLDRAGVEMLARELLALLTPERCILLSSHDPVLLKALDCPQVRLTGRVNR